MKTITKKSLVGNVLLIILGLTCCCVVSCGGKSAEDTTPPGIFNINVFDVTDTSAQVSWETDEPAKGQVVWALTDKMTKESKSIVHEEFTTMHSFKITDLLPSKVYYCWAASSDSKGNWKVSESATFTTLAKQTQ